MGQSADLSIVIPSYNSAEWLPSTLESIFVALSASRLRAEILIVDDGSTDDTEFVLSELGKRSPYRLRTLKIENSGVYEAVRQGAIAATYERILIVNSRLLVSGDAFEYLEGQIVNEVEIETRNGHVTTANDVPIVGRFWEVPTHVFWGSYLRSPKSTEITSENFDTVPKGTGFLVIDRQRLLDAYEFIGEPGSRFVSDDTRLLRRIASDRPILLEPCFRATYRPRTTFRKFLEHALLRGTLFVDSYYGTTVARTLVLIAIGLSIPIAATVAVLSIISNNWIAIVAILGIFVAVVLTLAIVAAINRASWRAIVSFVVYVIPFGCVFWAGVIRGLWLRPQMVNHG